MVLRRATLREHVAQCDLALRVEFLSAPSTWEAPAPSGAPHFDRQEFFRVRALEAVVGAPPAEVFEFFPHAEGFPAWARGDQALLFLERTARFPEFAALAERFPWFSLQGAGAEWRIEAAADEAIVEAARAWARFRAAREAPPAAVRAILLRALGSSSPRLRLDALAELLALAPAGLLASAEDVAPFAALVDSPSLAPAQRGALTGVLEGRPGFDAAAAWERILAPPLSAGDARALVRLAARSAAPPAEAWLVAQLASPEPALRREAAAALGDPRRAPHAARLAALARDPDDAVARAAIDSLAAMGGDAARAALERTAAAAGEPRAHWAQAALRRLAQ